MTDIVTLLSRAALRRRLASLLGSSLHEAGIGRGAQPAPDDLLAPDRDSLRNPPDLRNLSVAEACAAARLWPHVLRL